MSHLIALIDAYKDTHGAPSDSSIARAVGISPQTISSWRRRGVRETPSAETLRTLARFIGQDYATVVLPAVLRDVGLLDALPSQPPPPTREDGIAGEA